MNKTFTSHRKSTGFTLVELVIGMVVLAVALMAMSTMLIAQNKDAREPLHRLRASQLGQSIMQNIISRSYDEKSHHNGAEYRCGEVWWQGANWYDESTGGWSTGPNPTVIPCSTHYGIDASSNEVAGRHQDFNDVDDFIQPTFVSAETYGNILGGNLDSQFALYSVMINVVAAGLHAKQIVVTVRTPSGEDIVFSALKGNY